MIGPFVRVGAYWLWGLSTSGAAYWYAAHWLTGGFRR